MQQDVKVTRNFDTLYCTYTVRSTNSELRPRPGKPHFVLRKRVFLLRRVSRGVPPNSHSSSPCSVPTLCQPLRSGICRVLAG